MVDKEGMDPLEAQKHLGHGHHDHYHWYDYALVLPWLWKSFVHAKHEAFAFKYDPEVMRLLEENEMRPIRTMMYFWTVMYYIIIGDTLSSLITQALIPSEGLTEQDIENELSNFPPLTQMVCHKAFGVCLVGIF